MTAPPEAAPHVRVLELRSVFGTGGGPEKTILLGAAAADAARVSVTVCYLRDVRDRTFHIDRRARELGVDYLEVVERHSLDLLRVWRQLLAVVRERGITLVHSHEYKTDLLAWLLGKYEGLAILSTAHGWTGHSSREQKVYYPANKRLLARFPAVVAVSSEIRRELIAHGARGDRVEVLLNGIDPALFRRDRGREAAARIELGIAPGAVVIGSAGRLASQKRFDLLIQAFGHVAASRPGATLLIAGEGDERASLTALIAALGLESRCRLLGHCADIIGFHHALDMFVQSSDYEGTPNVVLEAMALESPIVATDVGGTSELCHPGEHGLIVPPGSADTLAEAMESALADPDASRARAVAARRRVESELSFERRLRRLEDIYVRLARESR